MQAYLNDSKLKENFLEEIRKHQEADAVIQGTYGDIEDGKWKGCAVGCSLKSMSKIKGEEIKTDAQERYEDLLGVPQVLARLEDGIFEGLPEEDAKKWPLKFSEAINVGADLSLVWPKFAKYILVDERDGVIKFANGRQDVIEAIKKTAEVWDGIIEGKSYQEMKSAAESIVDSARSAAWSARSAAWSAAWSAWSAAWSARSAAWSAWSAAESAWPAAESAWSAAESAARSARSAAWSAAESAWSAAESAAYQRMAEKLLELLREAK